jgi:hypothetical protein
MKIQLGRKAHLFCAVVLLMAVGGSRALSQSDLTTPEDLTRGSDVVAVGKVKELKSEWGPGKYAIVTRVTVTVNEFLKGGSGQTVTVLVPGGEVDGVGEWYSHTSHFTKDEDVVLFAKRQGTSEFRLTGGEDGRLVITKDPQTGTPVVAGGLTLDELRKRVKKTQ